MAKKITEREQKLIDYIQQLVKVLSAFSLFYRGIADYAIWFGKADSELKIGDTQADLMKYLESEFDIKYTKVDSDTKEEAVTQKSE